MQNVDLVDSFGTYFGHRPRKGLALDDFAQSVACSLGHLLGVVEQRVVEVVWQNDGCSKHRPGKTTATSLVEPGLNAIDIHTVSKHSV